MRKKPAARINPKISQPKTPKIKKTSSSGSRFVKSISISTLFLDPKAVGGGGGGRLLERDSPSGVVVVVVPLDPLWY
jgi:hypothetical protein